MRKDTNRKSRLDLIEPEFLTELGHVLRFGAEKYAELGYRTHPIPTREYLGAAIRHIYKYLSGEKNDPESGYSHLAHATASLMMAYVLKSVKPDL